MKNVEIIVLACMDAKLPPDTIVNTFVGWKRAGYTVKRGEKAAFQTKIWKPCKVKKKKEQEPGEEPKKENKLILVNASFFTSEQVEKIS